MEGIAPVFTAIGGATVFLAALGAVALLAEALIRGWLSEAGIKSLNRRLYDAERRADGLPTHSYFWGLEQRIHALEDDKATREFRESSTRSEKKKGA